MFMGRVSLSDWSSSQFSCGLKHSFPLILKLRRKKERKTKKTKHVHFQLSEEENLFIPKSKDDFLSVN